MAQRSRRGGDGSVDGRVRHILATLERRGTKRNREGMARYAIIAPKAFGVSVATIRDMGKRTGRSHELAEALWKTGRYEARLLLVGRTPMPAAAIDNEGEQALTTAIMDVRARGGVVVVIAHRPSALAGVDLVLVMGEGRMQSFGPKDEVLSKVLRPVPARNAAEQRASAVHSLKMVEDLGVAS